MGLLDLKTDLKSLKYGKDRPGGGDSGQPYIKTDINTVDQGFNELRLTKFDDGLIRGGAIGALNASVVDTLRIGKFFLDLPKGPLFLAKQVGLQFSNPRLETKKIALSQGSSILNFIGNLANKINNNFGPTRIYNLGINTLAQVPVNAFGKHFNRHGLIPVQDDSTKYFAVVSNNNKSDQNVAEPSNRLVGLKNKLLGKPVAPQSRTFGLLNTLTSSIGSIFGFSNPLKALTANQLTIDDYLGGPGSVYGIGRTVIRRYDDTNTNNKGIKPRLTEIDYGKTLGLSNQYFSGQPTIPLISGVLSTVYIDKVKNINESNNIDLANPTNKPIQIDQNVIKYKAGSNNIEKYTQLKSTIDKQIIEGINPNEFISPRPQDVKYLNTLGASTQYGLNTEEIGPNSFNQTNQNSVINNSVNPKLRTYINLKNAIDNQIIDGGNFSEFKGKIPVINYYNILGVSAQYESDTLGGLNNVDPLRPTKAPTQLYAINSKYNNNGVPFTPQESYEAVREEIETNNNTYIKSFKEFTKNDQVQFPNGSLPLRNTPNFKYFGNRKISDDNSISTYDNTQDFQRIDSNILQIVFRIQDPFTNSEDQINFSAYMSGFKDNFTSTWNEINYSGRAESFYIYDKFKRDVSFNLQIPCFNKTQLLEKHRALGQLAAVTAGSYNPQGFLGGVLIRLNVGKYIVGEYAILDNLSYSIPDQATWDITEKLAMTLDASFSFKIIHKKLPQYKPNNGFFGSIPDKTEYFIPNGTSNFNTTARTFAENE